MSGFTALNIEPEEDSEDEIDDSKEIQIEEALKSYQNALRLHSQGPRYFVEAELAYKTLFRSEIFSYPESLPYTKQIDLYGDFEDLDDGTESTAPGTTALPTVSADEAPNTLNQVLFLARRNWGQYLLDRLKEHLLQVQRRPGEHEDPLKSQLVRDTVVDILECFVEAVDRDDTDSQLWRLIAKLSLFLGSKRLARYCLEAVLDTEDAGADASFEMRNLEESFAAEQLKDLIRTLDDDVSESQAVTAPGKSSNLLKSLRKHMDPCPFLPTSSDKIAGTDTPLGVSNVFIDRRDIPVAIRTWGSVGKAIQHQISHVEQGAAGLPFGAAYIIILPDPASGRQELGRVVAPLNIETATGPLPSGIPLAQANIDQPLNAKTVDGFADVLSPAFIAETSNQRLAPAPVDSIRTEEGETTENPNRSSVQLAAEVRPERSEQGAATSGAKDVPDTPLLESPRTMSLPTRKRSSEAAGLPEPTDLGRSKSKRIKARESAPEAAAEDLTRYYDEQLHDHTQADRWLFEFVANILAKLDVKNSRTYDELKKAFASSPTTIYNDMEPRDPMTVAIQDMKSILMSWSPDKSNAFLGKTDANNDFGGVNGARNFTSYLENSKRGPQHISDLPPMPDDEGLVDLVTEINQNWTHLDQLAFGWIKGLLSSKPRGGDTSDIVASAYERFVWTSSLKETAVQVLVNKDDFIYRIIIDETEALDDRLIGSRKESNVSCWGCQDEQLFRLAQNIFELHLDVYERITNPSSKVDLETRAKQRDRLGRWAALTYNIISQRAETDPDKDELRIRFLWSSVLYVNLTDATARDHVVLCFQDLKRILLTAHIQAIMLPNNAAMPEISHEAADREISSLTTMDFFLGIFNSENNEPIAVIESLEPILQRSIGNETLPSQERGDRRDGSNNNADRTTSPLDKPQESKQNAPAIGSPMDEIVRYLNKASLKLRLFLWQRLGAAYESIDYLPQVVSCNLRRIGLIVEHLQTSDYTSQPSLVRQLSLSEWLGDLERLISTTQTLIEKQPNAFEIVDLAQLQSSMAMMFELQRVIHVYVLWLDSVRVGQNTMPQAPRGSATTAFMSSMAKIADMQIKTWKMQFFLIKEATVQAYDLFGTPKDDLIDYLNLLHYSLGLRELCGGCEKSFLRLMKTELLLHRGTERWEHDYAQVIFDLHGVRICPGFTSIRNHGCTPEILDRATAFELMDYVLVQANRMAIKDLAKSELKSTIDRMQQAIKTPKPSNASNFNKRAIAHFLRSPVNPLDMYRAFQGIGELSSIIISNDFTVIADKGWYSLLGQISLARFRAQKRSIPGPLDDLDFAMTFFKLDLELGMEKWETWYRLAQAYDTKIEENTRWNADKISNGTEELKALQRSATVGKMSDMYSDFATRIYASSREPFSMKAFSLEDFARQFSNPNQGMYKKRPFRDLQLYPAWVFASYLLRRALDSKADNWMGWYMLGKCLWKMYDCNDDVRGRGKRPDYKGVLNAITRAIEAVPDRCDNRHPEKEPVLEPHYKLVSIVHKLVQKGQLQPAEASSYLKATYYARKVPPVEEADDWEMYISQVLKALRAADKLHWHHRMAARAAHIIYDDSPNDIRSALGAKHELTQQIFTKTMAIQVWRPDNERAGRHFVYTSRYAKFFVRLLFQLNDKASFEALSKRIRKRSGEFLGHGEIWQEVCLTYLELLRRQAPRGRVPAEHEMTVFKSVPHEIFVLNADRLESWAHLPDTTSPLLDIIKETVDLKKTNLNLMKAGVIEDLIGDTYALLYEQTVPDLIARSNDEENRVRMRVDHVLAGPEASASASALAAATPPLYDPAAKPGEAASTKPRFKGVTRREVQKRAEALVAKPAPAPAPAATVLANAKATPKGATEQPVNAATLAMRDEVGTKEVVSSVPGSVHDSADDESELSELEEFVDAPEKPATMMFPNLAGKAGEEEEDDDDDNGDDEEEGEDGEGEGEGEGKYEDGDEDEDEETFRSPEQQGDERDQDGRADDGSAQPMDVE
ncbi:MAG: hypothetical protein Q9191_001613 [Dirinaria sp. TL-2023a]